MCQRDPRGLMELRRLAYKAKRSEAAREVLHDALLETWPEAYAKAMQTAKKQVEAAARANRVTGREGDQYVRYVVFRPRYLKWRKDYRAPIFFHIAQPETLRGLIADDVIVYRVTAKAKSAATEAVMFRRDREGDLFALLVNSPEGYDRLGRAMVSIFTPYGHTSGPYYENIRTSRPATPMEYAQLERQMTSEPYNYRLRIVRRRS